MQVNIERALGVVVERGIPDPWQKFGTLLSMDGAISTHLVEAVAEARERKDITSRAKANQLFSEKLANLAEARELLHILLTDNTRKLEVRKIWQKMFPRSSRTVRNHVVLHAVHKYIYVDVLKNESELKQDIELSKKSLRYKRAWDIVEKRGYKEIMREFKGYYR